MNVRITEMVREIWLTVRGLEPVIILMDRALLDDRGKVVEYEQMINGILDLVCSQELDHRNTVEWRDLKDDEAAECSQ